MAGKPELVQFGDLTAEHFARHPVWINCHVADYDEPWYGETDEETFRPRTGALPAEVGEGMLIAHAKFTLADGSTLDGFVTPGFDDGPISLMGLMQPNVFLPNGALGAFWEGMFPRDETHRAFYDALGKSATQVFPVRFAARDGLVTGIASGELLGFYSMKGDKIQVRT